MKARMQGLRWEATNVPIPRDAATFEAVAIPNTVNGGNGYGSSRKPTLRDLGNPRLTPEEPRNPAR